MPKAFILVMLGLLGNLGVSSQTLSLSEGRQVVCSGTLVDPGGAASDYQNQESLVATLCPTGPGRQLALTFRWSDIRQGDELCVFDGEDVSAPELTCSRRWTGARLLVQATAANPSGCLTLTWNTNPSVVGRGFEAEIDCKAICQPVVPQARTLRGQRDSTGLVIDLCPGDFITLSAGATFPQNGLVYDQSLATTSYRWELPNGQQRRGPQIQYGFAEPGGYLIELHARDGNGCSSLLPDRIRVRVAAPPEIGFGSDVPDTLCAPDVLTLTTADDGGFKTTAVTQYFSPLSSRTDSLPLPDGTGASHESTIVVSQFADGATLTQPAQLASICASMEHSWLRDLSIELTSPDGRTAVLHNHPGRFGEEAFLGEPVEGDIGNAEPIPGGGYEYCWTDDAARPDWLRYLDANPGITTLPAGEYESYDPFSVLIGSPLNGAWTLRIKDHWEADNGWIFEWSIAFADDLPLAIDSFEAPITQRWWIPDPSQSAYQPTEVAYAPTVPGTITAGLRLGNAFGCTYDTTVTVHILPESAPACGPCTPSTDTLPQQVVLLGDTAKFDFSALGGASSRYRYLGQRSFSFATHPPGRPLGVELAVLEPPFAALGPSAEELTQVCVDLSARRAEELTAALISPRGERLQLTQNDGGGQGGLRQVCFSPTAAQGVGALAQGAREVRPRGDWTSLAGAEVAGTWRLELTDGRGFLDSSRLHSWWLDFGLGNPPSLAVPDDVFALGEQHFGAQPSRSQSYTFSYVDDGGCLRTLVFPILVKLPCALNLRRLAFRDPSCAQETDGELLVASSGAQGEVAYTLGLSTNSTGKFTRLSAGPLMVTGVDSAQCTDTLALSLTAPEHVEVRFAERLLSCDPPLYEVRVETSSNLDVREAAWLDGSTASFRENLSPARYTYKLTDERGCVSFHPLNLTRPIPPEVTVQASPLQCTDDGTGSIRLLVQPEPRSSSVAWSDGDTTSFRENLYAGDYEGVVRSREGCETSFSVSLTEPEPLAAELSVEPSYCPGESSGAVLVRPLGNNGPHEYRLDGGPWQAEPLFYGLAQGRHEVEVRDVSRCMWSEEVFVGTASQLDSNVLDVLINRASFGDTIALEIVADKLGGLTRVLWRYTDRGDLLCDTCASTQLVPYATGSVLLMVEDTLGCRLEVSSQLLVSDRPQVFVPTGFMPEGGTLDDQILRVHGRSGTVIERFVVFDRWGTQVFEARDLTVNAQRGWDGTYRGQPAPAGSYLYEVLARDAGGSPIQLRGSTTLLR